MYKFIVSAVLLIALSGCANTIKVKYDSVPIGALLYLRGESVGKTPVTLEYAFTPEFNKGGCILSEAPLVAKWVSGAEQSLDSNKICFEKGVYQEFTFLRPANVPNLEADEQYAREREHELKVEAETTGFHGELYTGASIGTTVPGPPPRPSRQ